MTVIRHGRLVHVADPAGAARPDDGRRTELLISIVLAAWAIVLLSGYVFGAVG